MLAGFYEGAQNIVHQCLVAFPAGFEPLQHVMVDADVDVVLWSWEIRDGSRPVGLAAWLVGIGFYGGFELLAGQSVHSAPVRAVFTPRDLRFDLFCRIAHGSAFLPHPS